jgi:hypothetical protein
MRHGCLLIVLFLMSATHTIAQEPGLIDSKIELSVGSSVMHFAASPSINLAGVNLSGQYRWTSWMGLAGDFQAGYGAGASARTILFGPEISIPRWRFSPFAHILVGGAHLSQSSTSDNAFATELGGGVEVNVEGKISWKCAEFDYLPTYFHNGRQDNFRFGTGLVFRF